MCNCISQTTAPPLRFSLKYDIVLLNEVIAHDPYSVMDPEEKWVDIAFAVTEAFNDARKVCTSRRAKERTKLLLEKHKKENDANVKKYAVLIAVVLVDGFLFPHGFKVHVQCC